MSSLNSFERQELKYICHSPWANADFGTKPIDKGGCCELIVHFVEIKNLYDNLSLPSFVEVIFFDKAMPHAII